MGWQFSIQYAYYLFICGNDLVVNEFVKWVSLLFCSRWRGNL